MLLVLSCFGPLLKLSELVSYGVWVGFYKCSRVISTITDPRNVVWWLTPTWRLHNRLGGQIIASPANDWSQESILFVLVIVRVMELKTCSRERFESFDTFSYHFKPLCWAQLNLVYKLLILWSVLCVGSSILLKMEREAQRMRLVVPKAAELGRADLPHAACNLHGGPC